MVRRRTPRRMGFDENSLRKCIWPRLQSQNETIQQSSIAARIVRWVKADMALMLYTQQFRVQNRSDPSSFRKV